MRFRYYMAILLNLLLPGSGLIIARREWVGFFMALLFSMNGQLLVVGQWIAPRWVPWPVQVAGGAAVAAIWLGAQIMLARTLRRVADPTIAEQLTLCHQLAQKALAEGRNEDAYGALQVAQTVDDEDLPTQVELARLMTHLGRYHEARRAWRVVEQLDGQQQHRREMVQALDRLPANSSSE
ncbi:MAG: hypothetical protein HJJLKODD_02200 [Phycisphaerae bacterium]|nr:hypothetical protein [Phycisphaerae bacterium]